jgi:tetratricopeptide (TPR) repeat protein
VAAAYEAGKRAVRARDYDEARRQLERAVERMPEFTEAWYNLGATLTTLSIRAAGAGDDAAALALFKDAVAAKKRAQDLISEDKWVLYEGAERDQVVHDLTEALRYADEVLGDERSLLVALRLWAAQRGFAAP